MSAARISVIVPVHNGEHYLATALDSVLAQTCGDFEIIVVDDASTDATPTLLDDYGSRLVRLRTPAPAGPARARNLALQAAQAPLVAFLDADDAWHPRKLERQLAFAAARPGFGLITTDVEYWESPDRLLYPHIPRRHAIPQGEVLPQLLQNNWIATSAALAQRAVVLAAGGFDEQPCRLGEDWMLWMRVAATHPVYFLDEVLTRRRIHADSFGHRHPEATFQDVLRHLERLGQELAYLRAHPELVRQAAYALCLYRGQQNVHALQPQAARRKLLLARRYGSGCIQRSRALLWMLCSYAPVAWLRRAKRWKQRLGAATGHVLLAATWRRHEQVQASVAGERSPATARPAGGRPAQKVAAPPESRGSS